MDERRKSGVVKALAISKVEEGCCVDIYYHEVDPSDTIIGKKLEEFSESTETVKCIYIDWIDMRDNASYLGCYHEFRRFCNKRTMDKYFIITEPGYEKTVEGNYIFRPLGEPTKEQKEIYTNQIFFAETTGFRDTGIVTPFDTSIYIYRSPLSERYIKNLIKNEHSLY